MKKVILEALMLVAVFASLYVLLILSLCALA